MSNTCDDDVFKILLATDIHLGYLEGDAVRGSDSITTFEEILKIASQKEVDFILLGGDLFHENKPSRRILHETIALFRKYCMGDRAVQFEFLSDQSENFKHAARPIVNFEDPNMNISIPVFSIHGNHDDPAGPGTYCSLDLLSASGLVNYFGKCTDLQNISISPLMFQKGRSKICMYGLGSVRDERLHRMFLDGKVSMLRPKEKWDEWFNMMVVHQNRVKHGPKNFLPEQFLDSFLDLVVWGHEHECRIDQEFNEKQAFYVTQPGSSIATSLCHGEAVQKHVGLLQIRQKEFQITKIPLQTVRQFYIKDVFLEETSLDLSDPDKSENVKTYCNELVDQFLEKAEEEHSGHPKQPKLPLVRLRVFCPLNFEMFNVQRFGHAYVSKVANSKDIILFNKKKSEKLKNADVNTDVLKALIAQEGINKQRVEDLVKKYFDQMDDEKRLLVLSEIGVSSAIQEYVDKDIKETIGALVKYQIEKTQKHLKENNVSDSNNIDDALGKFRQERRQNHQAEANDFQIAIQGKFKPAVHHDSSDSDDEIGIEIQEIPTKTTRGRGRGQNSSRGQNSPRGRGRGSPTKGRGREPSAAATKNKAKETSPTKGRGRGSASSKASTSSGSRGKGKTITQTVAATRTSKRKNRYTDYSSYATDSEDEDDIIISDESDDEEEFVVSKRRKVTQSSSKSKTSNNSSGARKKRGVVFDISD